MSQDTTGRIVEVSTIPIGDTVAVGASVDDTEVDLNSTVDFNLRDGQTLQATCPDPTDPDVMLLFEVASVDHDNDAIYLTDPLTVDLPVDHPFYVYPTGDERVAQVMLDEGDDDPIPCRVPHALYDRIPEGIREPGSEEAVEIAEGDDGEWSVVDVLGQVPLIDGTYIDAATIPANNVTRSLNPPVDPPVSDGDVFYQHNGSGVVVGWWIGDGGVWEAQEIGGLMLTADAIDGKVITGATVQTSASGERIVITGDKIETWSGVVGESPGAIDPAAFSGNPTLELKPGTTATAHEAPAIVMFAAVSGGVQVGLIGITAPGAIQFGVGASEFRMIDGVLELDAANVTVDGSAYADDVYVTTVPTTVSAANCRMNVDGRLVQSTSVRAAKGDIADLKVKSADVLNIRPRTWKSKLPGEVGTPGVGLIAEELEAAGFGAFCEYREGKLTGVQYERLVVALLPVLRDQEARLSALEKALPKGLVK